MKYAGKGATAEGQRWICLWAKLASAPLPFFLVCRCQGTDPCGKITLRVSAGNPRLSPTSYPGNVTPGRGRVGKRTRTRKSSREQVGNEGWGSLDHGKSHQRDPDGSWRAALERGVSRRSWICWEAANSSHSSPQENWEIIPDPHLSVPVWVANLA